MPPAAEYGALRAECLRALEIVESTQLALFASVPPESSVARAARVDAALAAAGDSEERARERLRALLRARLARYRDPYANYIGPRAHDTYARRRRGDLVGVGVKFRARTDAYPLILGALLGGPLDGEDIAPGDVLVAVDGADLAGLGSRAVGARLAGVEGSSVALAVRRGDGGALRRIAVRRRTVVLHYARAERVEGSPDVGHIRVSRFGSDTHERVRGFVEAFERDAVRGIVLDLRDNPGGSTRAARAIVSLFDPMAEVYCERLAGGTSRQLPRHGEVLTARPLAVLVNERSMSSSEIVAGALQLAGRAPVIGAPTWGKGLIQKVFPLSPPLGGAVRTTIATFSTPDGQALHARGIVPDVYVPTAPHGLYRESGSLNVSAEARRFRRALLRESLADRLSETEARAFARLPDTQLDVAVATLER